MRRSHHTCRKTHVAVGVALVAVLGVPAVAVAQETTGATRTASAGFGDRVERERERTERAAERELERAEREARDARERVSRDAERAEREARERVARDAEREARERTEREARDRAEREAREAQEREARERAEREAREAQEREAREAQEREAQTRAARERADREARERTDLTRQQPMSAPAPPTPGLAAVGPRVTAPRSAAPVQAAPRPVQVPLTPTAGPLRQAIPPRTDPVAAAPGAQSGAVRQPLAPQVPARKPAAQRLDAVGTASTGADGATSAAARVASVLARPRETGVGGAPTSPQAGPDVRAVPLLSVVQEAGHRATAAPSWVTVPAGLLALGCVGAIAYLVVVHLRPADPSQ